MGVVSSALYFGFTRYHLLCSPMCLVVIIHPNVYPAIHIYNPRESDTPCQLHERSLSILYDECKDFDLVLVPDAPMASALNRRLDQPHFGPFAITPRRLAARRREQAEDRLAFLEIIETTDLNWKETSYAVGNILQCWVSGDGRRGARLRTVRDGGNAHRCRLYRRDGHDVYPSHRVLYRSRHVGRCRRLQAAYRTRTLDPSPDYETIDPFTEESFDHPSFHILDSPAAIVDAVLDAVTPENAADVAVVLDAASQYSPLIESALEAANIPYYGGPGFNDDARHRAFLQLLRSAHAGRDTRVGDVRHSSPNSGCPSTSSTTRSVSTTSTARR